MNRLSTDWQEVSRVANMDRRRENRIVLRFQIEVCGFTRLGRFFTERSYTEDISAAGCKFRLRTEAESDSILAIRIITRHNGREIDSRPTLFKIAWIEQRPNGWLLGTYKLQPDPVWPVDFPAPNPDV
jgi:hypothetical protein